eukprot:364328-Chlamydomonas_euryale.AAC.11
MSKAGDTGLDNGWSCLARKKLADGRGCSPCKSEDHGDWCHGPWCGDARVGQQWKSCAPGRAQCFSIVSGSRRGPP